MYVYDTKTGKEFVLPDLRGMRYAVCGKKPRNTPTYTSEHFKSTKGEVPSMTIPQKSANKDVHFFLARLQKANV